ncbi:unnamed protein product [Protopolystoma xenopodis]|uniref:Uncharacterized protein n=1 Tax=Protopolystoma xenopodis TaxID=117903 RepID=A0A3S5CUY4_9PLAT|nr:unnamed protein product [Protopolystoma xenopodis]
MPICTHMHGNMGRQAQKCPIFSDSPARKRVLLAQTSSMRLFEQTCIAVQGWLAGRLVGWSTGRLAKQVTGRTTGQCVLSGHRPDVNWPTGRAEG